ncbi:unnamed protein product [Camellia sinensis]
MTGLGFESRVWEVISDVIQEAVVNGGFAVGKGKRCLKKTADEVRKYVLSRKGRGLNARCYLRYSTVKFFNGSEKLQRSSEPGHPVSSAKYAHHEIECIFWRTQRWKQFPCPSQHLYRSSLQLVVTSISLVP